MEKVRQTKLTPGKSPPTMGEVMDVTWHKTPVKMYGVSDSQLEELTAGYNSLHLVFFGICAGAAITLLIGLLQLSSQSPQGPYYLAGLIGTGGLAVICGINGIGNYIKANNRKKRLYNESVPIDRP